MAGPSLLRGHFEKEVNGEEAKDRIWSPPGQHRGKQSDGTHRFEQRGDGAINNSDSNRERQPANRSARSHQEREGRSQAHNDRGNQWIGKLLLPLHVETRRVESSLPETPNVTPEFASVHLVGLQYLAPEIIGRLRKLGERRGAEGNETRDPPIPEIADPTASENPDVLRGVPCGAGSEDAAPDLERRWIEFEHIQAAEKLAVEIEKFVVIDFGVLAENPLVSWLKVRLRRMSLDLVAQRVLALIRVRKEGFAHGEHSSGNQAAGEPQGQKQSIEADPAGFDRDNFVVFRQRGQRDERRDQSRQRSEQIDHIGNQKAEVTEHHGKGNVVFGDVSQQIEQREGIEDQDERNQQKHKVIEESPEEIEIEEKRESQRPLSDRRAEIRGVLRHASIGRQTVLRRPVRHRTVGNRDGRAVHMLS